MVLEQAGPRRSKGENSAMNKVLALKDRDSSRFVD